MTTAVAKGDLSKKITVDVKGEILELKNTINTMVDQLNSFASEVTRVAREVGTEGKLGGQADVKGVAGTWKDLTDNVNSMAGNLTGQVRNIAEVTTAVANGDLSKKITVDVKGEILELKNTINTMVDQLNSFASEVTRVAREVGTEGKLGGQAEVKGVAGTWKDLTDNVNFMAGNLTGQVRNIAEVTTAVANGDLSKKITVDVQRRDPRAEEHHQHDGRSAQLVRRRSDARRARGRHRRQARRPGRRAGVAGTWKDLTDNVNSMAGNLTGQVRNIAEVTTAVANGDLSKKITVDVKGEILELKNTINTMVDQLNSFASEVTRVAREVGTEGKLGGQAEVKGVAGTWKDLTDNVNLMAGNLTEPGARHRQGRDRGRQRRPQAQAHRRGQGRDRRARRHHQRHDRHARDLRRPGDHAWPARSASRASSAARPSVPGAAGTWRDLTDNVNQLAANLTTQVRAIAEVATAVTKGDLTRSITVEAQGEVAALKDNINEMIRNLKDTTLEEQRAGLAEDQPREVQRACCRASATCSRSRKLILSELAPLVTAQHGVFYIVEPRGRASRPEARSPATRTASARTFGSRFALGEGLVGQCALEKEKHPAHQRAAATTSASPRASARRAPLNIIVLPVLFEGAGQGRDRARLVRPLQPDTTRRSSTS